MSHSVTVKNWNYNMSKHVNLKVTKRRKFSYYEALRNANKVIFEKMQSKVKTELISDWPTGPEASESY